MSKLGAILFDAYGTLFDLKSAVQPHVTRLGDPAPRPFDKNLGENSSSLLALWRQKQLEYTWTSTIRGEYWPFDTITRAALDFALARELATRRYKSDPALGDDLMESFGRLEPDVHAAEVLKRLKEAGLKLGILSNGTPRMLAKLLDGHEFAKLLDSDLILSVDAVKAYKPDRRVYQLGVDTLGLPAEQIGFVSGNAWDAAGAAGFGFDTYWIFQAPEEYGLSRKVSMLEDFGALPDALP